MSLPELRQMMAPPSADELNQTAHVLSTAFNLFFSCTGHQVREPGRAAADDGPQQRPALVPLVPVSAWLHTLSRKLFCSLGCLVLRPQQRPALVPLAQAGLQLHTQGRGQLAKDT